MVKVGIVGLGFMGVTHYRAYQKVKGANVVAVCETDSKRLSGDWREVAGNLPGETGREDLTGIAKYPEVEGIVNDPKVELLDVCLPTYAHCDVTVAALKAGKHVIVEKPIALNLKDADRMIETAEKAGRFLAVAQVLRFFPEFAYVKELADTGKYGELLGAHFKRIAKPPLWGVGDWFRDLSKSGGPIIDLHIHDADFVQYMLGMPDAVCSTGVTTDGHVLYVTTAYLFAGRNLAVTASSGWVASVGFEHGVDAYFEHATVQFNSAWGQPLTVYTADGKKIQPKLKGGDAWQAELQYVINCLRKNEKPQLLSGETARNSLLLCLKEAQSVQKGKPVKV